MATDTPPRLRSLDIFRGATIASMILVNNPGSFVTYAPLEHAAWHGWTFTDTVFPFFLWIVGVAMTLSTARRVERGEDRGQLLLHTFKRAAIIFLLGFLLGPFPNINWATIRIPGVLQRIAVCYLIAGIIFLFTKVRGQIIAIVALNVVYWCLMTLYPTPGCGAGSMTVECNFARYIDGLVIPGHMWSGTKVVGQAQSSQSGLARAAVPAISGTKPPATDSSGSPVEPSVISGSTITRVWELLYQKTWLSSNQGTAGVPFETQV